MNDLCPTCAYELTDDVYCYECGYDAELEPVLIDQLDSELECQKIDIGVYDPVDDDDGQSFFNEFAR